MADRDAKSRFNRDTTTAAKVAFRTETGSVYELTRSLAAMSWRRVTTTLASGVLRSEEGVLLEWPTVTVGERCQLVSVPINEPWLRVVVTSQVVAILEGDGRVALEASRADPSFRDIRPGDSVTRVLGGAPMRLVATEVDERFIYCGPPGVGWKFDRDTGVEVDEDLGWGPAEGFTGSYLVLDDPADQEGASD